MRDSMKQTVITALRLKAQVGNKELVNHIAGKCPSLNTEQIIFIENALGLAAARAISNTLQLTPQQFNSVRIKHG